MLILQHLVNGCPAITSSLGGVLSESASVCLADQGHGLQSQMAISGTFGGHYVVNRPVVTSQMSSAHNDLQDATEYGACGIAILLIKDLEGLTVVERSRKGTGIDYWMGDDSNPNAPFQRKARLEVSGILNGTEAQVNHRVNKKLNQTNRSAGTGLDRYVVVVEFSAPKAMVVK